MILCDQLRIWRGFMAHHSLVFVQILVHITALYRMSVFTHSQV